MELWDYEIFKNTYNEVPNMKLWKRNLLESTMHHI